jgi:glycosyltransferase involved in cell wall biosynthesis
MSISVFITSYNQKEYLVEAIESVLAQTLRASQIIVVDDCSQDGSRELISGYASRYSVIMPIFHRRNLGVAQARNTALEAVTGDYVTYVDGDDRFLPTKLEMEAKFLDKNSSAQIAFSNVYHMQADGKRLGTWIGRQKPPQGDVFRQTFARDFPQGILFRNELVDYGAWKRIGFYDPRLRIYEDYDMRIRLTKHLRTVYIDEALSEYRGHDSSLRSAKSTEKLALFDYICTKNRALLDDLSVGEYRYVQQRLERWRAKLIRMAAKEALGVGQSEPGDRRKAVNLYRRSLQHHRCLDYDLILGLVLPHRVHRAIRSRVLELREGTRNLAN